MKLLSSKEAANYLHISVKALQALRERGTVKAIKFGTRFLYRPETLDKLAEEYENSGKDLIDE